MTKIFHICEWIFFEISSFSMKKETSLDHKKYVLVGKKIPSQEKKDISLIISNKIIIFLKSSTPIHVHNKAILS